MASDHQLPATRAVVQISRSTAFFYYILGFSASMLNAFCLYTQFISDGLTTIR